MQYLFFDIECSNSFDGTGKICEFGYVLTDKSLSVIDRGIFLINPDSEFEQYVIWKIISYKVNDYLAAPKYPEVYKKHIKPLLELKDTVFVGHGVRNDLKFLCDEAKRYSLSVPVLDVVDAALIWQRYHKDVQKRNLKKLVKELGIGNPKEIHNSEYDAKMTLEYIKVLCEKSKMSLEELREAYFSADDKKDLLEYPASVGQKPVGKKDVEKSIARKGYGRKTLRLLLQKIGAIGERSERLKGKRVSVSDNYTADHFNELLNLVGLIKAAGGEYELYAERSNIFCTYIKLDDAGKEVFDKKRSFVKSAISNGKSIEEMPLDELLRMLGISCEELEAMPEPDIDSILEDKSEKKETVGV